MYGAILLLTEDEFSQHLLILNFWAEVRIYFVYKQGEKNCQTISVFQVFGKEKEKYCILFDLQTLQRYFYFRNSTIYHQM